MTRGYLFVLFIYTTLGKFEQILPNTRCFQEPGVVGDCSNNEPTWTYVPLFGCYKFQYGGCGGNGNNFYSKKECQENCEPIKGSSLEMDPIPNNGEKTFPIDKARRKKCKYEHGSFIIKKKKPTKYFWIFEGDHNSGSIKCFIGYISQVTVEIPARHCGLGTIFTTLCMVDEDMNGPNGNVKGDLAESNQALDKLDGHPKKLQWVKSKCRNFWSLLFVADLGAANTYFNAALDAGFTQMLLEDSEDGIHGPAETKDWKENYDPQKGLILKSIKVLGAFWFFCQPN